MIPNTAAKTQQAVLLLILPPLFWAGNIVVARGTMTLIPPLALSFWRWMMAFILVTPLTLVVARRELVRDWPAARAAWRIMLLLSFFGVACFNTLLYTAVHYTTAINGSLMQTAMPAFVILISLALFHERINRAQLLGLLLAITGAATVVLRGSLQTLLALSFNRGDLLILLGVGLYAFYTALPRLRPAMHELSFIFYTFGAGSLMLLPLVLWERAGGATFTWSAPVTATVLYVALFPSIAAYLAWNRGTALLGANRAGLFINLVPVFAATLAILFLGEQLQLFHLAGLALLVSGLVLFNQARAGLTLET